MPLFLIGKRDGMIGVIPPKQNPSRRLSRSPPLAAAVAFMSAAMALESCLLPMGSVAEEFEYVPDVVIVMKDKAFHIIKEGEADKNVPHPIFTLAPNMDVVLLLRNEDTVAHEFVSPLLQKVDLQLSGKATMVYTFTAAGVRVDPRQSVLLRFDVPDAGYDQFHFWCNIHGKLLDDPMRGEIFVLKEPSQKPRSLLH